MVFGVCLKVKIAWPLLLQFFLNRSLVRPLLEGKWHIKLLEYLSIFTKGHSAH